MANTTEHTTNTMMTDMDNTSTTGKKAFSVIYSIDIVPPGEATYDYEPLQHPSPRSRKRLNG
jgi:hypothetical protein